MTPVPVLAASALGGVEWVSVFGHGAKHTPSPGVRAAEGGSRGRQSRCCSSGDEPTDNSSCKLVADSLPPSKLLKSLSCGQTQPKYTGKGILGNVVQPSHVGLSQSQHSALGNHT